LVLRGDALAGSEGGLTMDWKPDMECEVESPGYGAVRRDCPALRCDGKSHWEIPLGLRINNVPIAFLGPTQ
jgi:hypothetical protein